MGITGGGEVVSVRFSLRAISSVTGVLAAVVGVVAESTFVGVFRGST